MCRHDKFGNPMFVFKNILTKKQHRRKTTFTIAFLWHSDNARFQDRKREKRNRREKTYRQMHEICHYILRRYIS